MLGPGYVKLFDLQIQAFGQVLLVCLIACLLLAVAAVDDGVVGCYCLFVCRCSCCYLVVCLFAASVGGVGCFVFVLVLVGALVDLGWLCCLCSCNK